MTEGTQFFSVPTTDTSPRHPEYDRFVQIIADLRSPNGCPWDRKQTHSSIAKNMLEEAYEAVAAIEEGDIDHLREELGDVLLEVVLQAQIAQDAGEFTIEDVAHDVSEKIIRRHPHIYGAKASFAALGLEPSQVEAADQVENLWDTIKSFEKQMKDEKRAEKRAAAGLDCGVPRGLMDDVSKSQPALMQAQEISRKAVSKGFEWESVDDVWAQVYDEIEEFKEAPSRSAEAEMEFGDILFSLVNVARKEHLDAETCLRRACDKFRMRWEAMERFAYEQGREIGCYGTDELEELWCRAKEKETSQMP